MHFSMESAPRDGVGDPSGSSLTALLRLLASQQVRLEALPGDRLVVHAPHGQLSETLRGRIAASKSDLLKVLRSAAHYAPEAVAIDAPLDLEAFLRGESLALRLQPVSSGLAVIELQLPRGVTRERVAETLRNLEHVHPLLGRRAHAQGGRQLLIPCDRSSQRFRALGVLYALRPRAAAERFRMMSLSLEADGVYVAMLIPGTLRRGPMLCVKISDALVDRESVEIVREFLAAALSSASPASHTDLPKDGFLRWVARYDADRDLQAVEFWSRRADRLPAARAELGDVQDTGPFHWNSFRVHAELGLEACEALRSCSARRGWSPTVVFMALWLLALTRVCGRPAGPLSIRVSRRWSVGQALAVGRFDSVLYVWPQITGNEEPERACSLVAGELAEVMSHSEVPRGSVFPRAAQGQPYVPTTAVGYLHNEVQDLPPEPRESGKADRDMTLITTWCTQAPPRARLVLNCYRGTVSRGHARRVLDELLELLARFAALDDEVVRGAPDERPGT